MKAKLIVAIFALVTSCGMLPQQIETANPTEVAVSVVEAPTSLPTAIPTPTVVSSKTPVVPSATATKTVVPTRTPTKTPIEKLTATMVPAKQGQSGPLSVGNSTTCNLKTGATCFVQVENSMGRLIVTVDPNGASGIGINVYSNEQLDGVNVRPDQWKTPKGRGNIQKDGKIEYQGGNPGNRGKVWLAAIVNDGPAPAMISVTIGGLHPDRQCISYFENIGPTPNVWWTLCS